MLEMSINKKHSKYTLDFAPVKSITNGMIILDNNEKVTGVKINDLALHYKDTAVLKPSVTTSNGAKYAVEWLSSNTDVAKVDANGKITATKRGSGSATITCKVTDQFGNTVKDTCNVKVSLTVWQWVKTYIFFGWIWY